MNSTNYEATATQVNKIRIC